MKRIGDDLGSSGTPRRRHRFHHDNVESAPSAASDDSSADPVIRWDKLDGVRPSPRPQGKVSRVVGRLRTKAGYQKVTESAVVREWTAQPLAAPVLGYLFSVVLGGTFAAIGLVHLVSPTTGFPRLGALAFAVVGLVFLANGLRCLISPARRVVLQEDGTMSFIGWHRRLDVLPGQVQSVSGRSIAFDLGQNIPWRVSTNHGSIRLAARMRDGESLVSAILAHSPNAQLSRGFLAFSE
jgi:hypothetical protein